MRYKGCLIAVAAAVALFAAVAVVVGPSVFREGRRALAPPSGEASEGSCTAEGPP